MVWFGVVMCYPVVLENFVILLLCEYERPADPKNIKRPQMLAVRFQPELIIHENFLEEL